MNKRKKERGHVARRVSTVLAGQQQQLEVGVTRAIQFSNIPLSLARERVRARVVSSPLRPPSPQPSPPWGEGGPRTKWPWGVTFWQHMLRSHDQALPCLGW
jgi:hypothetical protein